MNRNFWRRFKSKTAMSIIYVLTGFALAAVGDDDVESRVGGCKRGVAPQASASASYQNGLSRLRWVGHGVLLLMNLILAQSSICIV